MATVDWYFDFVSPFAYLQSEQLGAAGAEGARPLSSGAVRGAARARTGRKVRPRSRASACSPTASSSGRRNGSESRSRCRPSIRSIRCRCCAWRSPAIARRKPCTGSSASCGATDACPTCRSNGRSSLPICGCPTRERRIAEPEVKDALRRNTDEAIARGVFGVPTLVVGDELFWGADATAMAADYIAAGQRWTDPEYERVAALPVGAARSPTPLPGSRRKSATARLTEAPRRSRKSRPADFSRTRVSS